MSADSPWQKMLFLVIILLLAANLLLVSFHLSDAQAGGNKNSVLLNTQQAGRTLGQISHNLASGIGSIGSAVSAIGQTIGSVASKSAGFVGHGTLAASVFVMRVPGNLISYAIKAPSASAITRVDDNESAPTISEQNTQPVPPTIQAAQPVAQTPAPPTPVAPTAQWPLHGRITTAFGANDLPFERYHTGIDITDGRATPIKPFKAGRVVQAARSYYGLGNHIVVDHGSGITSVYGHLRAISVAVGQQVNEATVLGYEGSTGASTGTHLHFETRINGVPVDPHRLIPGQP